MATMVIPITVSDIPMPCAIDITFSIVRSPPKYRRPEPIAINPTARGTDDFCVDGSSSCYRSFLALESV